MCVVHRTQHGYASDLTLLPTRNMTVLDRPGPVRKDRDTGSHEESAWPDLPGLHTEVTRKGAHDR